MLEHQPSRYSAGNNASMPTWWTMRASTVFKCDAIYIDEVHASVGLSNRTAHVACAHVIYFIFFLMRALCSFIKKLQKYHVNVDCMRKMGFAYVKMPYTFNQCCHSINQYLINNSTVHVFRAHILARVCSMVKSLSNTAPPTPSQWNILNETRWFLIIEWHVVVRAKKKTIEASNRWSTTENAKQIVCQNNIEFHRKRWDEDAKERQYFWPKLLT